MQTFLPQASYYEAMKCLDPKRLGNQVYREGLTLIRGGWKNHPAYKMWKGHEYHLGLYLLAGMKVLNERGRFYPESQDKIESEMMKFPDTGSPQWLGDERLHSSHRAALLKKDFEWYNKFGWAEQPDPLTSEGKYNYWWPL